MAGGERREECCIVFEFVLPEWYYLGVALDCSSFMPKHTCCEPHKHNRLGIQVFMLPLGVFPHLFFLKVVVVFCWCPCNKSPAIGVLY